VLRYAHEHGCPWDSTTCHCAALREGTSRCCGTRTSTAARGSWTSALRRRCKTGMLQWWSTCALHSWPREQLPSSCAARATVCARAEPSPLHLTETTIAHSGPRRAARSYATDAALAHRNRNPLAAPKPTPWPGRARPQTADDRADRRLRWLRQVELYGLCGRGGREAQRPPVRRGGAGLASQTDVLSHSGYNL
jgi:hypothetical protein